MVDWNSPQEIIRDALAFEKLIHVLLGLYIWEWANSVDFDLLLLTGKRKFKWPMIFYLLNRYSLLTALVSLVVSFNIENELNCQPLYVFCQVMGNFAIGFSSVNLCVRTLAVWKGNKYVIYAVVAMILGHWGLLFRMVETIHARWIDGSCQVIDSSVTYNSVVYSYTMVFDFTIMILTGIKIQFGRGDYRSELVRLLYIDGIMYFAVAFVVNLIAVIFIVLNLNPSMSVMAEVPATTAATIAACRAVRHLSLFVPGQGPDIYSIPQFNIPKPSTGPSQERPETRINMTVIPNSQDEGENAEENDSPTTIKVPYDDFKKEERSPVEIKVGPYPYDLDLERGEGKSPVEPNSPITK
ncbi:hypothetical protein VKT23_016469 [Stygiomarasmius scandens]|uniref:Uncharacterized protein n=1 Tax=Marasmiellus scandens TaxID=2682957 RepID=A0ABR1IUY7_9AGAR